MHVVGLLLMLAVATPPGAHFPKIIWQSSGASRPSIDLGVWVAPIKGPSLEDAQLRALIEREARRLGADAFVYEKSDIRSFYAFEKGTSVAHDVLQNIAATVANAFASPPSGSNGSPSGRRDQTVDARSHQGFFRVVRFVDDAPASAALQTRYTALTSSFLEGRLSATEYERQRERLAIH
jgi:hypothetical protein